MKPTTAEIIARKAAIAVKHDRMEQSKADRISNRAEQLAETVETISMMPPVAEFAGGWYTNWGKDEHGNFEWELHLDGKAERYWFTTDTMGTQEPEAIANACWLAAKAREA